MRQEATREVRNFQIGDVLVFAGYRSPSYDGPVFAAGQHIKVTELTELDDAFVCVPADPTCDEWGDIVFTDEIASKVQGR